MKVKEQYFFRFSGFITGSVGSFVNRPLLILGHQYRATPGHWTWEGSTTVSVPATDDSPAYDMSMGVSYTFEEDYSMSIEVEMDMTELINQSDSQMAGAGAFMWSILSMTAGTKTDPETGMEVTTSYSDGSPYIMTTTTTGTIDPDDLTSSDVDINDTGTKLKVQADDGADGEITMILTKQ